MTVFELLSVLVALLSALVAFVSLYRTREVSKRQIELQERQVALERESSKLAKLQREQIEAATDFPSMTVTIHPVTIHYSDGDLHDTAVELIFENGSALNRSINDCAVGLLDNPADAVPQVARQAEYQDNVAEYPIAIPPYSSLILYSFARRLKPIYEDRYGVTETEDKGVAVRVSVAGMKEPLLRVIGRYSPANGLRPM
jgi:hypothetical protein